MTATRTEVTAGEIQTIVAARRLRHTKTVFIGVGRPSTAALLARMVHNPELILVYESGTIGAKPFHIPLSIGDGELAETADSIVSVPEMFNYWIGAGRIDVAFLGAAQIDRYANLNSTVIGDYDHPKTRLPGAGGAPEIAASCGEVIVIAPHAKRTFVEKLDFVTTVGHGDGPGARERLGFRGKGPTAVITDLGVLEPDPETRELVLTQIHPGVDVEQVREETGWDLRVADELNSHRAGNRRGDRRSCGSCSSGERRLRPRRGPHAVRPLRRRPVARAPRRPGARTWSGRCSTAPRTSIPAQVDEVLFGDANQAGEDNRNVARMACAARRTPDVRARRRRSTGCAGRSLDAAMQASREIETGDARRGAGRRGRVDEPRAVDPAQARARLPGGQQQQLHSSTLGLADGQPGHARQWTISLGESAEKLAGIYKVSREAQDAFALRSHQRAAGGLGERLLRRVGDPGPGHRARARREHPRRHVAREARQAEARLRGGRDGDRGQLLAAERRGGRGAARLRGGRRARRPRAARAHRLARRGGRRSRRVRDRPGQGGEHRAASAPASPGTTSPWWS